MSHESIHDLVRSGQKEKARAALEAEILKGLASGESSFMTDRDWEAIRGKVRERYERRRHD
jgi:antitoxin ParD1/3/4